MGGFRPDFRAPQLRRVSIFSNFTILPYCWELIPRIVTVDESNLGQNGHSDGSTKAGGFQPDFRTIQLRGVLILRFAISPYCCKIDFLIATSDESHLGPQHPFGWIAEGGGFSLIPGPRNYEGPIFHFTLSAPSGDLFPESPLPTSHVFGQKRPFLWSSNGGRISV